MSNAKAALRNEARARRKQFVSSLPDGRFLPPLSQFSSWFDHGVAIASYCRVGSEADPVAIEAMAIAAQCLVSWPRVEDRDFGGFRTLEPRMVWEKGPHNISQPPSDGSLTRPRLILVPLLAFDRSGTRLGQGAGWYDHVLPQHPDAIRIGVGWSAQEMDELPREDWDIPMHYILTEKEWIDCGQS